MRPCCRRLPTRIGMRHWKENCSKNRRKLSQRSSSWENSKFPIASSDKITDKDGCCWGSGTGGKPASTAWFYARTPLDEPDQDGHTHTVQLLAGKSLVIPTLSSQGHRHASTSRVELRGLLILTGLVEAILLGFQHLPEKKFMAGDSGCTEREREVY